MLVRDEPNRGHQQERIMSIVICTDCKIVATKPSAMFSSSFIFVTKTKTKVLIEVQAIFFHRVCKNNSENRVSQRFKFSRLIFLSASGHIIGGRSFRRGGHCRRGANAARARRVSRVAEQSDRRPRVGYGF